MAPYDDIDRDGELGIPLCSSQLTLKVVSGEINTFFSVSDPNSAKLLSFQSYFFALTRPDILSIARQSTSAGNSKEDRKC